MFYVRAYGLLFRSPIALPFAPAEPGRPDVTIRFGAVDASPGENAVAYGLWRACPGALVMDDPMAGRILVRGGEEIVIAGDNPDAARVFLTGSALTALLQQRGFLTLHASSVMTPHGAAAFIGVSGAGKSTLMAALLRRGHALIADDVTALSPDAAGDLAAIPAFPAARLWGETMDALAMSRDGAQRRMAGLDKFVTPIANFHAGPTAIRCVYGLAPELRADVAIDPIEAAEGFALITRNTHRRRISAAMGLAAPHFAMATRFSASARFAMARRPIDGFMIEALADAIEADLAAAAGRAR